MQYQYNHYVWPLVTSTFVALSLGIYSLFKQRNAKGAKSFILWMFLVVIWSAANALEMASTNFSIKLFWANVQYIAFCYIPVTLLALCLQFTGYDHWIRNKRIYWIALIPSIVLLLVWTDSWHGLIRYDLQLDYRGSFPVITKKYGPVFFIHAGYSHLLNITSWLLLLRTVLFKNTVYRRQAIALLFGISLIILSNVMYISGLSPVKRFDITPVFLAPAGLIIAWGIFRFKLFDLIPMARSTVVETMEAGFIVLDLQDRVLDINPAFEKIVGINVSQIFTKTVREVCGNIPELVGAILDRNITYSEFSTDLNGAAKDYEVLLSQLTDSKGTLIGRLAVIYDITEKKQAEREFLQQQWKLAVIEEREKLARDLHDNLGQVLGFINLQAQGIRQEIVNAGAEIALFKLDKLVEVTQSAHEEIREYIRNARNLASTERNFRASLARDIVNFEEQTGLQVELNLPVGFSGEELEPNVRINLMNIVREALNNIGKHACAEHVKIALSMTPKELCATVEDDGKGFEILRHEHGTKTKFGLDIMRERTLEIGAEIKIQSAPGQGTKINVCLPLKEERKK